jgi:hypothetical protein
MSGPEKAAFERDACGKSMRYLILGGHSQGLTAVADMSGRLGKENSKITVRLREMPLGKFQ